MAPDRIDSRTRACLTGFLQRNQMIAWGKPVFARFRHTDPCYHTRLRLFAVDDLSQAVGKVRVSESGSDHR